MESRKLQLTGGSTYIVSLPKNWVSSSGLSKNDAVIIMERADGTLLLSPGKKGKRRESTITVAVHRNENPVHVRRRLLGAYIGGCRVIKVKATKDRRIEPEIRNQIREFTSTVIGAVWMVTLPPWIKEARLVITDVGRTSSPTVALTVMVTA